ncbi:hypothetical protein [Thermococcus sp. JCM 11816]|uniref:hypothetical protein n=1 Tax=Thermococcus sp. (strain JCM 11816 / KS-1) TaxID=1295125 RepID=UPI00346628FA
MLGAVYRASAAEPPHDESTFSLLASSAASSTWVEIGFGMTLSKTMLSRPPS